MFSFSVGSAANGEDVDACLVALSVSVSSSRPLLWDGRDGGWEPFDSGLGAGLGA